MVRRTFLDPAGERFGLPTFPWRMAPDNLHTRRQLAAMGLRPIYVIPAPLGVCLDCDDARAGVAA
ncbi:hypothetical protein FDG2_1887 [Candidatus Protofrankia californiensis]|uniref:Uncharacterized protein n=1 Tax=Candidatus Protofrankia californiensis TaxID=1839754 RepID=A0A1C3NWJ7_9ACTN|nr:hypothetical protein FDG2_1887 [Candidatus Protofrankia californiensis]